jgi:hypothetical protein
LAVHDLPNRIHSAGNLTADCGESVNGGTRADEFAARQLPGNSREKSDANLYYRWKGYFLASRLRRFSSGGEYHTNLWPDARVSAGHRSLNELEKIS